jgi:hypothetical protein
VAEMTPNKKTIMKKKIKGWGKGLPSKCEVLSSNSSTEKKKKKIKIEKESIQMGVCKRGKVKVMRGEMTQTMYTHVNN